MLFFITIWYRKSKIKIIERAKMHHIINRSNNLALEFNPDVGGSITAFYSILNGVRVDLMRPAPKTANYTELDVSSFPLTPFSNRIAGGKFTFDDKEFSVGPNFRDEPQPNHGDGWTSKWSIEKQTPHSVTLGLKSGPKALTPYVYSASQTFTLNENGLSIDMSITNNGQETLPFGLGHHPYFRKTPGTILKANLSHVWESSAMIPTNLVPVPEEWNFSHGKNLTTEIGAPVNGFGGNDYIDGCFQGWDRKAEILWPEDKMGVRIESDLLFSHFVIYVPQADFLCAEPVSHATDAFNLSHRGEKDVGFKVLKPNESMSGRMTFTRFDL